MIFEYPDLSDLILEKTPSGSTLVSDYLSWYFGFRWSLTVGSTVSPFSTMRFDQVNYWMSLAG